LQWQDQGTRDNGECLLLCLLEGAYAVVDVTWDACLYLSQGGIDMLDQHILHRHLKQWAPALVR
jgi:hypothetical protein